MENNVKNNMKNKNKGKANSKKERNEKDADTKEKANNKNKGSGKIKAVISISAFIIIIIAVIFGAYQYYVTPQQSTSFSTFISNFNSAPKISIVVSAMNSTDLSYAIECETQLILSLTSNHENYRNPSSMNLYVIEGNNCTYLNGLGSYTSNYINTGKSECLNMSSVNPTIYINYSNTNSTVIKQNALYFSGNSKALQMCGIAPELSSTK
ncbi:MAG: hypothetical protein ACP5RI_03030 [Candidatus Micrarchaeia archaeon]